MARLYIVIAFLFAAMAGCARDRTSGNAGDSAPPGRARWWNYYERGTALLDAGDVERAAEHFRTAIRSRGSDDARARTYGLHFVPYFPNRELGIAYYENEEFENAERFLNKSIEAIETARGVEYLNRVYEAQHRAGSLVDEEAPRLVGELTFSRENRLQASPVQSASTSGGGVSGVRVKRAMREGIAPLEMVFAVARDAGSARIDTKNIYDGIRFAQQPLLESRTARRKYLLEFSTFDDNGIDAVFVNRQAASMRKIRRGAEIRHEIELEEGENEIEILVRDVAAKTFVLKRQVVSDSTGPLIGVFEPANDSTTRTPYVDVDLTAQDESGLRSVTIDGQPLFEADAEPGNQPLLKEFSVVPRVGPLLPGQKRTIEIRATDRSEYVGTLVLDIIHDAPNSLSSRDDAFVFASRVQSKEGFSQDGTWPRELFAQGPLTVPDIKFGYEDHSVVYSPDPIVAITATSLSNIVRVRLGGVEVNSKGRTVGWSRRVDLAVGENRVESAAIDSAGLTATSTVILERRPSILEMPENRLRLVSVDALSLEDPAAAEFGGMLNRAVHGRQRFDLADASEGVKHSSSGVIDSREALRASRASSANVLGYRRIERRGLGLEVVVQFVDVTSGEILDTLDAQILDADDREEMERTATRLAIETADLFPNYRGEVRNRRIALQTSDTVREGTFFWLGLDKRPKEDFEPVALVRTKSVEVSELGFRVVRWHTEAAELDGLDALAL